MVIQGNPTMAYLEENHFWETGRYEQKRSRNCHRLQDKVCFKDPGSLLLSSCCCWYISIYSNVPIHMHTHMHISNRLFRIVLDAQENWAECSVPAAPYTQPPTPDDHGGTFATADVLTLTFQCPGGKGCFSSIFRGLLNMVLPFHFSHKGLASWIPKSGIHKWKASLLRMLWFYISKKCLEMILCLISSWSNVLFLKKIFFAPTKLL